MLMDCTTPGQCLREGSVNCRMQRTGVVFSENPATVTLYDPSMPVGSGASGFPDTSSSPAT